MEANSIKLIQKTDAFDTAKENMAFDESLLESLNPNQRIERFYIWKTRELHTVINNNAPII